MEITLVNCEHVIRPSIGGLPLSYTIGTVQVNANNIDEVMAMVQQMQSWANGTFAPVQIERPAQDNQDSQNGPIIVHNRIEAENLEEEKEEDTGNVNPITGEIL